MKTIKLLAGVNAVMCAAFYHQFNQSLLIYLGIMCCGVFVACILRESRIRRQKKKADWYSLFNNN